SARAIATGHFRPHEKLSPQADRKGSLRRGGLQQLALCHCSCHNLLTPLLDYGIFRPTLQEFMHLGGAYVQPVGSASWGVPAVWHVPCATQWKTVGIFSRTSFGLSPLLPDLHFLWGGWFRAGSGSTFAFERHRHTNFGAAFSRRKCAVQRQGAECSEHRHHLASEWDSRWEPYGGDD